MALTDHLTKKNGKYLVAEGSGGIVGYALAIGTTVALHRLDVPDTINVLATLTAKSAGFWGGNIAAFHLLRDRAQGMRRWR